MEYVEVLMTEDDFLSASYAGIGKVVIQELMNGKLMKPVLFRITNDPDPKPWATDNDDNYNRIDQCRSNTPGKS